MKKLPQPNREKILQALYDEWKVPPHHVNYCGWSFPFALDILVQTDSMTYIGWLSPSARYKKGSFKEDR
jgi:hypothetical protein